jgi:hypothetical protein
MPKCEKSIVTRDTEGLEMSLHVVEKVMTRECMRQVHKLSERHFAGNMCERLRKSCKDRLSIRKFSTEFDRVELHLLHLVSHGIDPDDVGLIKKLAMGSGCCCT